MAKQIIITQNDYGINLYSTIKFESPEINLVDKTLLVDIVPPSGVKYQPDTQPIILNPLTNEVSFLLTAKETQEVGLYYLYFYVTNDNSKLTAQKPTTYYVLAEDGGVE